MPSLAGKGLATARVHHAFGGAATWSLPFSGAFIGAAGATLGS